MLRTRLFDDLARYGYGSLHALAQAMGWPAPHLSRIRAGKRPITARFVRDALKAVRTGDPRTSPTREELFYEAEPHPGDP